MNTYKDFFIDIDKFDEDNITYVKPILFYKVSRNMGIYYKKEIYKEIKSEPNPSKKSSKKKTQSDNYELEKITKKQKIIIKTPKMIVPFGIKEYDNNGKKSYQMCLSFSTLTNLYNENEIKKFFSFIKKIDTVNEETIMDYRKSWKLPKKIKYRKTLQRSEDFPYFMNINLPYDENIGFLFKIYNESAKESGIDIIQKKAIVSCVIELTDLKFTDKDFRSNWNVMQIRKFKPYSPIQEFFMSGCFICDEDDPEDTAYMGIIERYKKTLETPINIPRIPQLNANYSSPPPPPPPMPNKVIQEEVASNYRPPTKDELLNAMNKLKKTTTVVKGLYQNDDVPPPPPPPMVKSKKSESKEKKAESKEKKKEKKAESKELKIEPKSESKKKSESKENKSIKKSSNSKLSKKYE